MFFIIIFNKNILCLVYCLSENSQLQNNNILKSYYIKIYSRYVFIKKLYIVFRIRIVLSFGIFSKLKFWLILINHDMHKIRMICQCNYFTKSNTKSYERFYFNSIKDIKNDKDND